MEASFHGATPIPVAGRQFSAMGEMLSAIMEGFSLFIQELQEIFLRVNRDAQGQQSFCRKAVSGN